MSAATKGELLAAAANRRRFKTVPLLFSPDITVRIRSLTNSEMRSIKRLFVDKAYNVVMSIADRMQQMLVAWCVVDDNGERQFTNEDALGAGMDEIDGAVLNHLYSECKTWTGFAADSDWSAIEDAAKNSNATTANA